MGHYDSAYESERQKTEQLRRDKLLQDVKSGKYDCLFDAANLCGVHYVSLPIHDAAVMLQLLKELAVEQILKK